MKYAIIGLGFIFSRHKKSIEETGGELLLTCDIDEKKNADFKDYKEMFKSPKFGEIDTVVICTPNYLHSSMAREALRLGKKVLCEKPLSINGTDGLERVNVVLQLRCNPIIRKLKENLSINKVNTISIEVKTYREPSYWNSWKGDPKKSGGILYNMGIHYIDLLQYLLGDDYRIMSSKVNKYVAEGLIHFNKGFGKYHIELLKKPSEVIRKITVNGIEMDLEGATIPLKDKGQVKNLHTEVYKNFIEGKGVPLSEAKKSLELVANLLKYSER